MPNPKATMNRKVFFALVFAITQLSLIFCHIYTSSTLMKYSYRKQKYEKRIAQLNEQKNELTRTLEELKSPSAIKAHALGQGMTPLRLKRIKHLRDIDAHELDTP